VPVFTEYQYAQKETDVKLFKVLAVCTLVLFISVPAFADDARDYIDGEAGDWVRISMDNGYNLLGSYIGTITEQDITYTVDLAPGVYHFYSSGGMNITDLDLYIYDSDGSALGSDTYPDKIPIVVVNISERMEIQVNVQAFSFAEGSRSDYFCIVLAAEDEGEVYSIYSDTADIEEVDIEPSEPDTEDIEATDGAEIDYMTEVENDISYWETYELDQGNEVIDSGVFLLEGDSYSMNFDVEPGFYTGYSSPDSRCGNLDMYVYDANENVLDEDTLEDNFPYIEFVIMIPQEIEVVFDVPGADDGSEVYVSYILSYITGVDEDSRHDYMENELDWLMTSAEDAGEEIFDSGMMMVNRDGPVVTLEFGLEAGSYWIEADGGIAINDLDMFVYDEDGNLLGEDTYEDNYPMVWFDVEETGMVTIEVELINMHIAFDEDFFVWIVTSSSGWDDLDDNEPEWSGNEDELKSSAGMMGDVWMANAVLHGEEILQEFTEPIYLDPESKWIYEIELDEGTYYFYAQGDDICLMDLDMYIYDENGDDVTMDEEWHNTPVCVLEVGCGGGTYEIEIFAYWLDCEVGYFNLIITEG